MFLTWKYSQIKMKKIISALVLFAATAVMGQIPASPLTQTTNTFSLDYLWDIYDQPSAQSYLDVPSNEELNTASNVLANAAAVGAVAAVNTANAYTMTVSNVLNGKINTITNGLATISYVQSVSNSLASGGGSATNAITMLAPTNSTVPSVSADGQTGFVPTNFETAGTGTAVSNGVIFYVNTATNNLIPAQAVHATNADFAATATTATNAVSALSTSELNLQENSDFGVFDPFSTNFYLPPTSLNWRMGLAQPWNHAPESVIKLTTNTFLVNEEGISSFWEYPFDFPPGATNAVLTASAWTLSGSQAGDIYGRFWWNPGGILLTKAYTLTTTPQMVTASFPFDTNSGLFSFQFNSPFVVSNLSLIFQGTITDPVLSQPFKQYDILPSYWQQSAWMGYLPLQNSEGARVEFQTDAQTMTLDLFGAHMNMTMPLQIYTNGTLAYLIYDAPTTNFFYLTNFDIGVGKKTVEIVNGAAIQPKLSYGDFKTYSFALDLYSADRYKHLTVRSVFVPATNTIVFMKSKDNQRSILVLGDSIMLSGGQLTNSSESSLWDLVQRDSGVKATLYAGGYWNSFAALAYGGMTNFIEAVRLFKGDSVYCNFGFNDYFYGFPVNQFQTNLVELFYNIHKVRPDLVIYDQVPIAAGADTTNTLVQGQTLDQFRTAHTNAASLFPGFVILIPKLLTTNDLADGGIHPTQFGNIKYAESIANYLTMYPTNFDNINTSTGVIIDTNGYATTNYVNTATNGFITGNQTITLSGDATGSGATSISTTVTNAQHLNGALPSMDGSALTNIPYAKILTGSSNIVFTPNPNPDGSTNWSASITNIDGSKIGTGTIADARLSTDVVISNGTSIVNAAGAGLNANGTNVVLSLASAISPTRLANEASAAALPAYTYAAGVITETGLGALVLDGITAAANDKVLIKNETLAATNGLYDVTTAGSAGTSFVLTRDPNFNSPSNINAGEIVYVLDGVTQTNTLWALVTPPPYTVGTTPLTFVQTASTAGFVTASITNGLATTNYAQYAAITNFADVASINIPMGAWWSTNILDPATFTAATPTNFPTGDSWIMAHGVTNAINFRGALPWDWNAGTVQIALTCFTMGTNSTSTTNAVFSIRAAAEGGLDNATNISYGTAILVTNCVTPGAWTNSTVISGTLTVGNSPAAGKAIVWQIQRLGGHSADTETNTLAVSDFSIYYGRNFLTNWPAVGHTP